MPAPPIQQNSRIIYDYGTANFEETLFNQEYEEKYVDGGHTKVIYFYSNFNF